MDKELKIREVALKYALQNAVQFDGEAKFQSVIGKVIAEFKKEGIHPKDIIPIVQKVVFETNKLRLDEQIHKLKEIAPDLLEKEKKDRDYSLPALPDAEKGKVVTRFPPEPNGYLHIGHAKASIVDSEYAKIYDGLFILRFDDTNPENAIEEFYDAQKKDLEWLDVTWDKEYCTSDNIDKHYNLAEQLINQNDAYVCTCESEKIHGCRFEGVECSCRHCEQNNNFDQWEKMLDGSLDNAILRLKGEMTCDNTAMRDPTLFRIIKKPHPRQADKYRVWPTYDFAGAIEDSLSGVTHPFRTKEYELRDECYFRILDLLGLRKPKLMEFARLNIEGMPVSKRKIKPLIDEGKVSGYDDVRLPTLRGLRRRGITPEAIKRFVLMQGISKTESTATFSIVESENRKVIDPFAKRYFFVKNPIKLSVNNAPEKKQKINLHPTNKELGFRILETKNSFFVQKEDLDKIKIGEIFRLKDLFNVKIVSKNGTIFGEFAGEKLIPESAKIQWTTEENIPIDVFIPHLLFKNNKFNPDSLEKISGFAEKAVSYLKNDEIIQFERFGFVRIEKQNNQIKGFFAHK